MSESTLIKQIKRLIIVFDDVLLAALLSLLALRCGTAKHLIVGDVGAVF